jgi:cyclic pyranopterin phosphate synthase
MLRGAHRVSKHLSRADVPVVRVTTLDGDAPSPVFVSVRPHLRGTADGESSEGREPLTMPESGPLIDRYGRTHNDLRISVTDRCNLRCVYCMPEVGMRFQPPHALLTFDEMVRVARVARDLGITTLRLTGGEPLVRRNLATLVRRLSALGFKDLAMTTNAMLLKPMLESLKDAGLQRVNISCDSLKPERFNSIRRRGDLQTVLEAMDAVDAAGLTPLKLNVVILRGQNDDEILDFAAFARDTGRVVRFIEFMPLDAQGKWDNSQLVSGKEIFDQICARWPIAAVGEIGLISSVTQPFCGTCNRLRLTADGAIRNCLFSDDEHSLRDLMRDGADDDVIAFALRRAVWEKYPGHAINEPGFLSPTRSMSMIGG